MQLILVIWLQTQGKLTGGIGSSPTRGILLVVQDDNAIQINNINFITISTLRKFSRLW